MTAPYADVLNGLTEAEAAAVRALGTAIAFGAGETIFALGTQADALYLIERGQVALTLPMHVRDHDQDLLVEERTAGQTIGWSALIAPHRFTLKATALVETDVLAIPRETLLKTFSGRPALGYLVTANVAAMVGHRLQVVQAMWLREIQRTVQRTYA